MGSLEGGRVKMVRREMLHGSVHGLAKMLHSLTGIKNDIEEALQDQGWSH